MEECFCDVIDVLFQRREIEAQIQEQQKQRHHNSQLHSSLQKQPALNKVEEEEDVFNEVDGQTDVVQNPVVSMLSRGGLHSVSPRKPVVVNGDINAVPDRAPIVHSSPMHRGKCIGNVVVLQCCSVYCCYCRTQ